MSCPESQPFRDDDCLFCLERPPTNSGGGDRRGVAGTGVQRSDTPVLLQVATLRQFPDVVSAKSFGKSAYRDRMLYQRVRQDLVASLVSSGEH